jgi:hypothetical protein
MNYEGFLMKLFKLLLWVFDILDIYVFEPIFWIIVIMFYIGIKSIEDARSGNLYSSRIELITGGLSLIIISGFLLWYYWYSNFNSRLMSV